MATGNSINANSTGLVRYNGSGTFDGVTVTQHDVLVGAASNGITSVAPSATSGVPLISQGSSSDPTFGTVAIAGGGTNATSMSTSTGIVKYDGTSLVTSSTAKIDSSNRMTNSSQPAFLSYLGSDVTDVTGDGTAYTIVCDTSSFDNASNYSTSTGAFTAPVAGKYLFNLTVRLSGVTANHTGGLFYFVCSVLGSIYVGQFNPANARNASNLIIVTYNCYLSLSLNETVKPTVIVSGGNKLVDIDSTLNLTRFGGFLVPT